MKLGYEDFDAKRSDKFLILYFVQMSGEKKHLYKSNTPLHFRSFIYRIVIQMKLKFQKALKKKPSVTKSF